MYNVNKSDKAIKDELKQSSDRELLEFQCFLQHKQNQFLLYQLNTQRTIEDRINFFYKLIVFQIVITLLIIFIIGLIYVWG